VTQPPATSTAPVSSELVIASQSAAAELASTQAFASAQASFASAQASFDAAQASAESSQQAASLASASAAAIAAAKAVVVAAAPPTPTQRVTAPRSTPNATVKAVAPVARTVTAHGTLVATTTASPAYDTTGACQSAGDDTGYQVLVNDGSGSTVDLATIDLGTLSTPITADATTGNISFACDYPYTITVPAPAAAAYTFVGQSVRQSPTYTPDTRTVTGSTLTSGQAPRLVVGFCSVCGVF
jgi:hypothetical protein